MRNRDDPPKRLCECLLHSQMVNGQGSIATKQQTRRAEILNIELLTQVSLMADLAFIGLNLV